MPPVAPRQTGPHVWVRADVADPDVWTWWLSESEIAELLAAAEAATDTCLDSIDRDSFPLPTLGPKLIELRTRLTHGRGFELLRGFPSADVAEDVSEAAFVGLGSHLGAARSQNASGDLLGHVRNIGADANDPNVRIYQTAERQTFHTDSTDVVGLLCLETAAEGGDSLLVSVGAVYNEMQERAPRLAELMFEPIATDRRGEVPEGEDPFFTIPVLNWYDDALTVIYQRQYIESAARFEHAPPLTGDVVAALDLFDAIANDPDMHMTMRLDIGDMQFVHNHSLLHDRTGFIDKPGSPRHLLRLWLSVKGDRELPDVFRQRYGSLIVGDRGGIVVPRTHT